MSTLFADTTPEAEAKLLELLRAAPPWRKIEMMGALNRTMRRAVLCGLRERYPDATVNELRRRLAAHLYGSELAEKAYGPLPMEDSGHSGGP